MKSFLAGLALLTFASCYTPRYAYSPSAHNVPVITKQGDSKVAFNYSTNADLQESDNQYSRNKAHGYDVQGAVAVTNHFGLQGSYFSRRETTYSNELDDNNFDSSVIRYKRNMLEFGAGYYTAIDSRQKVMFQIFGGVGFGKTTFTDNGRDFNLNPYSRFYNSNLTKYYLEPAIIFRNKEIFAASLSTRLSVINFGKIKTNYSHDEKMNLKLDSLDRYASVFFEPAFVNSYGFKNLPGFRIEYQLGLSLLLAREEILDYRKFNFSVGLVFDIPKLIRGTSNKSGD